MCTAGLKELPGDSDKLQLLCALLLLFEFAYEEYLNLSQTVLCRHAVIFT